ncbi:MAG: asparagine synthase (glutamine-hydrolyzing) [Sphingomonadaceae bacterium]|nr:asparagine synthase (glutamine-hydrolyzing) [Sphingomonadaceae bacterium]
MCGIAGWFRRQARPVPDAVVHGMCDLIVHRGPDDRGVLAEGDFGFGMQRLSIVDLDGGHQPMSTSDGALSIVFNGEIYNHLDLRRALVGHGYEFKTHSDTETVLAAAAIWGDDAWAKLEGMFAIAIWDRNKRELTLVRDPLGIKPLYLTQQHGGLAFASELKSLRILPDHEFSIEERAVHDFFSFGHVRRPRSIYREVTTLAPGCFLKIGPMGEAQLKHYWAPAFRQGERVAVAEWIEQMRSALLESTKRHMQADVPVGAFLSGGVDSSAVLAAMVRSTDQPITAFTIGYPGAGIDESRAAHQIATHLGCKHLVLPLAVETAYQALPDVQRCFDEPFADMAAIPTWYASKLARQHVKVVLCGEGGDELFAGYKRHRNARLISQYRPLLRALQPFASTAARLPTGSSVHLNYLRHHIRRLGELLQLPDGYQQFFAATQISQHATRMQLYGQGVLTRFETNDAFSRLEAEHFGDAENSLSALDQILVAELTLNMPSAMLTRLDRASMAHSLEARVPLLSHKLVDWALTVPNALKLRRGTGKYLLRRAIEPWLPRGVVDRPKQGFQMPLAAWFRGQFGIVARETWFDSGAALSGYVDNREVERLFAEHRRGEANHSRMLYALAIFALWWRDTRPAPLTLSADAA